MLLVMIINLMSHLHGASSCFCFVYGISHLPSPADTDLWLHHHVGWRRRMYYQALLSDSVKWCCLYNEQQQTVLDFDALTHAAVLILRLAVRSQMAVPCLSYLGWAES